MIKKYPRLAAEFERQDPSNDHLFKADYIHVKDGELCEECCDIAEVNLREHTEVIPRYWWAAAGT
jgi:hypothetical protein